MNASPYLRLRRTHAAKLGPRSSGGITYEVLSDTTRTQLYLTVVANDGGGNWNREIVPLRDVEEALEMTGDAPFRSKVLAAAFVGRSANNAGFLAAVLVAEGLIAAAPGVKHHLLRSGDWSAWQEKCLTLEGEPIIFPPPGEADPSTPPSVPAVAEASDPPASRGRRGKGCGDRSPDDAAAPKVSVVEDGDDAGGS